MKRLSDLKNVGKATLEDLHLLDIHSVEELSNKDPTTLFYELERRTKARQDPVYGMYLRQLFMKLPAVSPLHGGNGLINVRLFKKRVF